MRITTNQLKEIIFDMDFLGTDPGKQFRNAFETASYDLVIEQRFPELKTRDEYYNEFKGITIHVSIADYEEYIENNTQLDFRGILKLWPKDNFMSIIMNK